MDCSGIGDSLPEFGEPPKKVCAVCQNPANKQCAACKGVDYCSAEHQKSHWKVHKKACSPIEIVTTPELGPHFVATRDLPPWTLLLTEHPVLVNPFVILKDHPLSCITCRSILPLSPCKCPECSTPFFCSISCSMNKIHSEFECGILAKCSEDFKIKLCMMPNLMHLRAIYLKNIHPRTWNKLLNLRGADQYKFMNEDENAKWFIQEILPLLGEKCAGFEGDMAKLIGITQQKGIVVHPSGNSPEIDHGKSYILYLKASNFVYACFQNCTAVIEEGPSFQLQVRNTAEVKKGQILSMDFLGMPYDIGAIARQHKWHKIGGALCICPRCTDPTGTELGTMQSAVKCTQPDCEDGYLLPVDPMNMANDALWRCNRTGCQGKERTWAEIEEITSRFEGDIATFLNRVPIEDVERSKEFWETLRKRLHPDHYLVSRFERKLVYELNSQMLDVYQEKEFSLPRLDLHIAMIEHLYKRAEVIDPGLSRTRGVLLNILFNGIKKRVLKEPNFQKRSVGRMRTAQVIEKLLPIAKCYPDTWTPFNIQELTERRGMELKTLGWPLLHLNLNLINVSENYP